MGCLILVRILTWALFAAAPGVWGLEPSTPLANYGRQSWAMESGLPQNSVQALAQTRDGFVWLGTESGLVRFDGVGFQVFDRNSKPALPANDVRCLLETADGALWIGTGAGLARWKDGVVTVFSTQDGLPANGIRGLAQDFNLELWAWTDGGLARLKGQRFEAADHADDAAPMTGFTARGFSGFWAGVGSLMAGDNSSSWKKTAARAGLAMGDVVALAALPDDVTAVAGKTEVVVVRGANIVARLTAGKELPGSRIEQLLADREGDLWIGTNGGLARLVAGKVQLLPATDPLARASVLALMEDREGDLWVGTENDGLHILRDQRFRIVGTRDGLSSDATTAVVEDGAGMLWVGTQEEGLNALHRSGDGMTVARRYMVSDGLTSNVILSLAAGGGGNLWVGTPDGLNRIHEGRVSSYTSADGLPDDFIRSLLVDADGALWIGTRRGLALWPHAAQESSPAGHLQIYTQERGLGSDLVGAMTRDAQGDLWVATLAGLSRLHGGRMTNFTTADGLSSNVITALLAQKSGRLLIGTEDRGWNLWDGQRFVAARVDGPGSESATGAGTDVDRRSVHAILDDGMGHLWFATDDGIARCDAARRDATGQEPVCSHWMEFGPADGLRSREMASNSHPSAWRSEEGLLWFATPKGLVEVDPAHFSINTLPPAVALERFTVDDVAEPLDGAASGLRVAAGHVHFEFEYAGLSFVAPQKVRYRYMLQGFDHAWTDAGARRAAYYTNIRPGRYTFRVQAANNDGVWNTEGAALEFELRPHFYQTVWFYILLLMAAIGGVILLLRLRLLRAEREFRAVLGERSRIAREIHDTLAQGYVGISVQLELLAELLRLRKVEAATEQLDQTRAYVREGLADARQSIWALRTEDANETKLPVKLRRLAEAAASDGLEPHFSVFGAYRPLPPETERELLRIAQEAIHNVKKHAAARGLWLQLDYGPDAVALEIRDDGRGGAVDSGHAGHFGITGMKERAAAIGGTLDVNSVPGEGTTVRLRAPAPEAVRSSMD
ncbi:MAG TPA: two-component regulator propeller domain-containing protein [Terracidiphilus sp.]|jgi:signal transduction histidine kinase/ligand-binding sensor domain-containing protein